MDVDNFVAVYRILFFGLFFEAISGPDIKFAINPAASSDRSICRLSKTLEQISENRLKQKTLQ